MGFRTIGVRGGDQKLVSGQTLLTPDANTALANQLIISPGPGRLYSLTCFNTGPTQYVQLFDALVLPSEGAVPEVQVKVLGDDDRSVDYGDGIIFKRGLVIVISTTSATKTLGAANCLIGAQFRLGR